MRDYGSVAIAHSSGEGDMGRFQGGPQVALLVAGVALALGGSALFAIVAHTKTPFYEAGGTAPPDSAPRGYLAKYPGPSLAKRVPMALAPESPPAAVQVADAGLVGPPIAVAGPPKGLPDTVPPDSLSQREYVVAVVGPPEPKPAEREPFEANFPEPTSPAAAVAQA